MGRPVFHTGAVFLEIVCAKLVRWLAAADVHPVIDQSLLDPDGARHIQCNSGTLPLYNPFRINTMTAKMSIAFTILLVLK